MSIPSKKERCQNWKLYVITDPVAARKRPILELVRAVIRGGASVIQLRDKTARDEELTHAAKKILEITRLKSVPLIVNDRIFVAKLSGADGVHLGQHDGSLKEARLVLGEAAIVGRSTHSPEQALEAQEEGFDYIGVGPVFSTPTKPDYAPVGLDLVRFASKNIKIPFVAIGGIDLTNLEEVRRAGAKTVAVVRAVMAHESPGLAANTLLQLLR